MKFSNFFSTYTIHILCATFFLVSLSHADIYIKSKFTKVQAVKSKDQPAPNGEPVITESWLSSNFARINLNPDTTTIIDFAKEIFYSVNNSSKTYTELNLGEKKKEMDALMNQGSGGEGFSAAAMMGAMLKFEGKVEKTTEQKKIGTWNCTKYKISITTMAGITTMEQWTTKDIALDVSIYNKALNFAFRMFPGFDDFVKELKKVEGCPVLTITTNEMPTGKLILKNTSELIECVEKTAPKGTYDVPLGFKKKD